MMRLSRKLTPHALTLMTIWPGPGIGDGRSSMTSCSGEQNSLHKTARISRQISGEPRIERAGYHSASEASKSRSLVAAGCCLTDLAVPAICNDRYKWRGAKAALLPGRIGCSVK